MKSLDLQRHFLVLAVGSAFWIVFIYLARRVWSDGTEFVIQFPVAGAAYAATLIAAARGASTSERVRFACFSVLLSVACPLLAVFGARFGATIIVVLFAPALYLELVKKVLLPSLPRVSYLIGCGFCFGSFFAVVALRSGAGYAFAPAWWLSISLAIAICIYERDNGQPSIQADGPASGGSAA